MCSCSKYDTAYERGRIRTITSVLPTGPGRALDIGCGEGVVTAALAARGYDVLGIDRDERSLEAARSAVPMAKFEPVDIGVDPLPDGPFDIIAACELLEHFDLAGQERLLHAIRAKLAPDGAFVLSTPNTASLMSLIGSLVYPLRGRHWDCGDSDHKHVHNTWSLRSLLERSGFVIARQRGFQLGLHRPAALASAGMRAFGGAVGWLCYDLVIVSSPARAIVSTR